SLSAAPGGRGGFAGDPRALSARQALEVATRGGAAVLGRDDIGQLAPGMSADFVAFDAGRVELAGAHDLVAALLYCRPGRVAHAVINGRVVVEAGRLTTIDLPPLVERHNRLARQLVDGD
ncbi:MAG: amidohydrolase family protein, partial [Candidatus Promineifilaceae bacterium]